jgi:hypothetical protein
MTSGNESPGARQHESDRNRSDETPSLHGELPM